MADEEYDYEKLAIKLKCERDHLFFTRYFFKKIHDSKFIANFHHLLISDAIEDVINGKTLNLIINIPPGGSKTLLVVINLIARGLAINPRSRFLHLSYSQNLASLNSDAAKELIQSEEFQSMWPMKIAPDSKAKNRWNVIYDKRKAGGVYATSTGGQVTGFRAGHMDEGFNGALIIDDPAKTEDSFSKTKLAIANRKLVSTINSRRASPKTPVIVIMQRIAENDPTGFIRSGGMGGEWKHLIVPALIDDAYIGALPKKYQAMVDKSERSECGRYSYWPAKERIKDLLSMEKGERIGGDSGANVSRFVFNAQYQQAPTAIGGNMIKGEYFKTYKREALPKIVQRKIFADTAQKTAEHNDFTVFGCYGKGVDGQLYLLDILRGKYEAPELLRRAVAFWKKHAVMDADKLGHLRKMVVEDKSSGTGLIQTLKLQNSIPIEAIERNKDKLTRVMDALPYIEQGMVSVPEDAEFTSDFISECESFTSDDTHPHDDQVDTLIDAVMDMLYAGNKMKQWENL
jgi:predicted phage terminase large subunit-like protein